MKVIIGDKVFDSNIEPVTLVFQSDTERKHVAGHLANMPEKDGVRLYSSYPENLDGHKILDHALNLLNETGR